ncbi:hypothetical protein CDAR_376271 [Caerostris darwini]|uniref:Uncharacterized protein n=1 Tax=Caerostris darwini TaxID=1538125 RepID=A0AAV4QKG9_9ARAC|nr:hypothetical protein CDAR_376271 [Caerostris darwini]
MLDFHSGESRQVRGVLGAGGRCEERLTCKKILGSASIAGGQPQLFCFRDLNLNDGIFFLRGFRTSLQFWVYFAPLRHTGSAESSQKMNPSCPVL